MPLPEWLATFNKHATNRFVRHIAGWAPHFAIVEHEGRKTGKTHETPVNVFRDGDRFLIALTYGGGSWVENVLAAGGCSIRTRGETIELTDPQRYSDPTRRGIPAPVRVFLGLFDVNEFLSMRRS